MRAYGDAQPASAYELDHLVPISLGGGLADVANLWPEPEASPNPKDQAEFRLYREVCAGQIALAAAQHAIATDWRSAP